MAPHVAPLIGVTTYPANRRGRYQLPTEYVDALRRAGADVVLLPPGPSDPGRLAWRLDGLVLAGGGDLDPAAYAGPGHDTIDGTDAARDRYETALVHHVLDTGLPTLAICRGSQVVNVALGGTLISHLPEVLDPATALLHRREPTPDDEPGPVPHGVTVEDTSLLAATMEAGEVVPMSWHHQAVDQLGEGLRVVARAGDGTIEATEHEDHPWLLSVQWHPELTAAADPTQQRLFDGLCAVAAQTSRSAT